MVLTGTYHGHGLSDHFALVVSKPLRASILAVPNQRSRSLDWTRFATMYFMYAFCAERERCVGKGSASEQGSERSSISLTLESTRNNPNPLCNEVEAL